MTTPVLPDSEAIAIAFMKAHAGLTAALAGASIASNVPADVSTAGALTVVRAGGTPPQPMWLDRAVLDLSAWGTSKAHASLIIRTALAAARDMEQYRSGLGVVTGMEPVLGPTWLPDESRTPTVARYVATVAIYVHP